MSENSFWACFWFCVAFAICGVMYGIFEIVANTNKTTIEMQNSCVSAGGSVIVGRSGDQQCIRFSK